MLRYPNLELLEYQFTFNGRRFGKSAASRDPQTTEAYMFPQTWPTTALGFNSHGGFAGQAFTKAYTTVFVYKNPEITVGGVFFDEEFAYEVFEPNEKFFEDIKEQKMASVANAHKRYDPEN